VVHGGDLLLEGADRLVFVAAAERAQGTREPIDERVEGVPRETHVLAYVDAPRADVGQQAFERDRLLVGTVAAVIDHHVDRRRAGQVAAPELGVGLIADEDLNALGCERSALWVDVHSRQPGSRTEIIAPHLQAAAAEHADFKDMDGLPAETLQMPVIDLEVVPALEQAPTLCMRVEVRLKRVLLILLRRQRDSGGRNALGVAQTSIEIAQRIRVVA
jgi:hypothetical protein